MTRQHITARLLLGASPQFKKALDDPALPDSCAAAGHALLAADRVLEYAIDGNTEWHIHRGIEALHHADWLYRKATQIAAGPPEPSTTTKDN